MEFKREQWFFGLVLIFVTCVFVAAKSINNYIRPVKCVPIKNKFLRFVLLVDRNDGTISRQSIAFVIIGYLLVLGLIAAFVAGLFISARAVTILGAVMLGVVFAICLAEGIVLNVSKKDYWRDLKKGSD